MSTVAPRRTKAFISYSHRECKYLKELQTHLTYFERQGLMEVWNDVICRAYSERCSLEKRTVG